MVLKPHEKAVQISKTTGKNKGYLILCSKPETDKFGTKKKNREEKVLNYKEEN